MQSANSVEQAAYAQLAEMEAYENQLRQDVSMKEQINQLVKEKIKERQKLTKEIKVVSTSFTPYPTQGSSKDASMMTEVER